MAFAFFDHTGDVGVDLQAPTLEELFASAAEALAATLTDLDTIVPREEQAVALEAAAVDLLLVDWLSELLYRFDAQHWIARSSAVTIDAAGPRARLEGRVRGESVDPTRHPIKVLVKAVTYHGLHVTRTAGGWTARVIFDI
jgi:SHS2 domain-containing protein